MTQYLIGAGAAKCGTTLLYELLCAHPEISTAPVKELHYFDREKSPDRAAYDRLFAGQGVKLDVTPVYLYYPECIEAIKQTLGANRVKLVVLLRDPIERARSHYDMVRAHSPEPLSLPEAFEQEARRVGLGGESRRLYSYFSRGRYAEQLDHLYRHIPRERVKVCLFEEFVRDQQRAIDGICSFAGIGRIKVAPRHANPGIGDARIKWLQRLLKQMWLKLPGALKIAPLCRVGRLIARANARPLERQPLDPAFRQRLTAYYADDVAELRARHGLDLSSWPNFPEP